MKKILSYLFVVVAALFGFVNIINAASIKVDNSVVGQEYKAYKIFDVTAAGSSYAYSIDSTNEWFSVVSDYATEKGTLVLTKVGDTTKYVVKPVGFDAADFAKYLNDNIDGKNENGKVTAIENKDTVIDGLAAGYYFVDSSLGALCILNTATDKLTVYEKNSEPTIDKTVSQTSASVGDVVTYNIDITAGGNADTSYVLHDVMSDGLTLNVDSFIIKVNGVAVDEGNYVIKTTGLTDDCTFEIEFKKSYVSTLAKDTVINVVYTAVVNEKSIEGDGETNNASLKYGNTSTISTVTVYNYDFDIVKVNEEDERLIGAQFKLFDKKTGGNEILLIKVEEDGNVYYRPVMEGEIAADYIEAGYASIKGLEKGTYFLEEILAPDGYNQLTQRVEIKLEGDLINESAIEVVNTTGSLLPSTGGIGTVLFVVIGSLMVTLFGVLLVTKLRLSKMNI